MWLDYKQIALSALPAKEFSVAGCTRIAKLIGDILKSIF